MIEITIPGEAKGKGRPRIASRNGFVRAFTPQQTRTREGIIASLAMDAMRGRAILTGAVEISLLAIMPIAASWSKKRKEAALLELEKPTKKPDLDNIVKLVWDALNGIVYADDSQVVSMTASKRYGHDPKTIVTIREIA